MAAPVWLKLERKEDGVYVYESDDGVNWTLVTTVAISLVNPFHLGLAVNTSQETVQAQLDQANILLQNAQGEVEVTETVGAEGGTISVDFDGAPRQVVIPAGALLRAVTVTVTVSAIPDTDYPDLEELRRTHPPELLNYISPKLTVELPLEALDWQSANAIKELMYLSSGVNKGDYDADAYVFVETRTQLADGTNLLGYEHYNLDEFTVVRAGDLQFSYQDDVPTTFRISNQVVSQLKSDRNSSSPNQLTLNTSTVPSSNYEEGLLNLNSTYTETDFTQFSLHDCLNLLSP